MTDVFEVLAADHADVEHMLTELEDASGRTTGASNAVLDARTLFAQRLVIDSSRHAAAEEQYFWPAVRKHVNDGDLLADQAIGRESETKEMLAKLNRLDARDAEFDQLLSEFIAAARQHIQFEEGQVWPKLRAVLTCEEASELGEQLSKTKEHRPTRPRPHPPPNPAILETARAAVGVVDQLRDILTGRKAI